MVDLGRNTRLSRLLTKNPSQAVIQDYNYIFDNIGNITATADYAPLTAMHTISASQSFGYDYINRLTSSSVFGYYAYDQVGNITQKEGVYFSYTDPNRPYCPASGSSGYQASYDAMAEKTDKNGVHWRYVYDDENMLAGVYKTPQGGTEALVEEYTYGAESIRTRKINYAGQSAITTYYVYLGNNVLYEVTGEATAKYILAGGKEIAKVTGSNTYYTHRDHLGSSSVVTDGAGNVAAWNANHPYGEEWDPHHRTETKARTQPRRNRFRIGCGSC